MEEGHQAAPTQLLGNKVVAMVTMGSILITSQSNVTFVYSLVEVEGSSFHVLAFASSLHRMCGFLPAAQMLETSILVCVWGGRGGERE